MCIVIPLTSNLNHLGLPYTAQVNKTSSTNLRENSVGLVFQIRIAGNARITGSEIGRRQTRGISDKQYKDHNKGYVDFID